MPSWSIPGAAGGARPPWRRPTLSRRRVSGRAAVPHHPCCDGQRRAGEDLAVAAPTRRGSRRDVLVRLAGEPLWPEGAQRGAHRGGVAGFAPGRLHSSDAARLCHPARPWPARDGDGRAAFARRLFRHGGPATRRMHELVADHPPAGLGRRHAADPALAHRGAGILPAAFGKAFQFPVWIMEQGMFRGIKAALNAERNGFVATNCTNATKSEAGWSLFLADSCHSWLS